MNQHAKYLGHIVLKLLSKVIGIDNSAWTTRVNAELESLMHVNVKFLYNAMSSENSLCIICQESAENEPCGYSSDYT